MNESLPPIWSGIFETFSEAKGNAGVFEGETWLSRCEQAARHELEYLENGEPSPTLNIPRNVILPVIASTLLSEQRPISVLDFGGAFGSAYFALRSALKMANSFQMDVVELPAVSGRAKNIIPKFPDLRFLGDLSACKAKYNIVNAASAIHYVDDWRMLLRKFASLAPDYLIITELTAGDIRSFVTSQHYYGNYIPVRFSGR